MTAEVTPLESRLVALFEQKRHDTTLTKNLVLALVQGFMTSKVESVDEVAINEPDEIGSAADEGWRKLFSAEIPVTMLRRAQKWAGKVGESKKTKDTPLGGDEAFEIAIGDKRLAAVLDVETLDLEGSAKSQAVDDIIAQGISSTRIIAMSLCLFLGCVVPLSKCAGCKWGEDSTLSPPAREKRKAGHRMLAEILLEGNLAELSAHFAMLMREFAEANRVEEAALVGSWWAEIYACFGMEKKALFAYVREYMRKYAGRGLPIVLDPVLATRVRGQTSAEGGCSKEELKVVRLKSESVAAELNRSLAQLRKDLKEAINNSNVDVGVGPKKKPGGGKDKSGVKCHNCGEHGHYAKNCPNKKVEDDAVGDEE